MTNIIMNEKTGKDRVAKIVNEVKFLLKDMQLYSQPTNHTLSIYFITHNIQPAGIFLPMHAMIGYNQRCDWMQAMYKSKHLTDPSWPVRFIDVEYSSANFPASDIAFHFCEFVDNVGYLDYDKYMIQSKLHASNFFPPFLLSFPSSIFKCVYL